MDAPNFCLDDRVALITGSGRGIGLGVARGLASVGCAVVIQDLDATVAEAEAQRIRDEGGKAVAIGGDITQLSTAESLVAKTVEQLGGLDILVNNAAIQSTVRWTEQDPAEMEAQFRANAVFPALLARHAAVVMRPRKWGRILNLGSIQQLKGNPNMLAYAASKSALENMTRSMARDLAPFGITANLIAPGYFNTYRNRFDWASREEMENKGETYVPLGRIGEPEDCAGIAVLLCSDAGGYITGQTIYVDGGLGVKN